MNYEELEKKLEKLLEEREKHLFKIELSKKEIEVWNKSAQEFASKRFWASPKEIEDLNEWKAVILEQFARNKRRLALVEEEISKVEFLLEQRQDKPKL